jgi:hypothetical protein
MLFSLPTKAEGVWFQNVSAEEQLLCVNMLQRAQSDVTQIRASNFVPVGYSRKGRSFPLRVCLSGNNGRMPDPVFNDACEQGTAIFVQGRPSALGKVFSIMKYKRTVQSFVVEEYCNEILERVDMVPVSDPE